MKAWAPKRYRQIIRSRRTSTIDVVLADFERINHFVVKSLYNRCNMFLSLGKFAMKQIALFNPFHATGLFL